MYWFEIEDIGAEVKKINEFIHLIGKYSFNLTIFLQIKKNDLS